MRDRQLAEGMLPEAYDRYLYRFGHIHMQEIDREGEAPGVVRRRIADSALAPVLDAFLGEDVRFVLNNSLLRRQRPGDVERYVPFHQDAAFMGSDVTVVNCWIPLVPCGVEAPGLEVVVAGGREVLATGGQGGKGGAIYDAIDLSEERVVRAFGIETLWHPAFELGDVLLFTNFTIHRTYVRPEMAENRISIEARAVSGGGLPERFADEPLMPLRPRKRADA